METDSVQEKRSEDRGATVSNMTFHAQLVPDTKREEWKWKNPNITCVFSTWLCSIDLPYWSKMKRLTARFCLFVCFFPGFSKEIMYILRHWPLLLTPPLFIFKCSHTQVVISHLTTDVRVKMHSFMPWLVSITWVFLSYFNENNSNHENKGCIYFLSPFQNNN